MAGTIIVSGCATAPKVTKGDSNTPIKLTGTLNCDGVSNVKTSSNGAVFVSQEDERRFDVVKSRDFVQAQCQTSKVNLIEIEAKETSKFFFWGGNLIVKTYKVLAELDETRIHNLNPEPESRSGRSNSRL